MNKICKFPGLVLAAIFLAPAATIADEPDSPFSTNIALSSDYVFRFVSQTLGEPALSAGFNWVSDNGFYLGSWGSNVDFGDQTQLELDIYGGYAHQFESGLNIDVGLIDYHYFSSGSDDDILEAFTSVGYGDFSLSAYYEIEHGDYLWLEGGFNRDLGPLSLIATAGTLIPDEGDGYSGWSLGVARSLLGFELSLTWSDTNSDGEMLFGREADSRFVVSLARSF